MLQNKLLYYTIFALVLQISALPDLGRWNLHFNQSIKSVSKPKSLFNGSQIFVQIECTAKSKPPPNIEIRWTLHQYICWQDYLRVGQIFINEIPIEDNEYVKNHNLSINGGPITKPCDGHVIEITSEESKVVLKTNNGKEEKVNNDQIEDEVTNENGKSVQKGLSKKPMYQITKDGIYMLTIDIQSQDDSAFDAEVQLKMLSSYGYLSAVDWPLLPFYGIMCIVYVILGLVWLFVSFLQWRDLLRIQFWIGGVILLGMLEKATFYSEYQNLNHTGVSVQGAVLIAEWVSCGKRTLARMLVIIVSLGFGIVKPRLGPMLHRVVGTGGLYFILAVVESYLRVMHIKNDPSNQILVASIPLAVLDSAICWWIFTSLVQTTRTLRLRRNMVKLSLYRHFTNTLIFAVVASVVFMLFSIKTHRIAECLSDWKELWVDEAFWHILFSVLLLVIMILWRPTNNNQRYAFTPLLDNPEDDDDDEDEQFVSDAYGVKMRGNTRSTSPKPKSSTNQEEDLRWVEENIPSAMADATLPILDSDEEILNTKFEVSKMQ